MLLLNILVVLNNAVLWIFLIPPSNLQFLQSFLKAFGDHSKVFNYYYSLIRSFHISDSRWFFTGVWVTPSLLKSPGLFLVFWQFSTMLSFGWSPLVRQPPSPLVPLVYYYYYHYYWFNLFCMELISYFLTEAGRIFLLSLPKKETTSRISFPTEIHILPGENRKIN